ncbi:MAG TPA: glycerophosphodiester phosphodiesterase family protein [Chitinophagaceae bacterium]
MERILIKTTIAMFLISLIFSCTTTKQNMSAVQFAANPVIAHRGAFKKNNLPENSIAALREAIRLQCTGSEFDVRMTADDSLIINHDPHYQQLEVEKSTYQQLSEFPLPNGEILPTLREYLMEGMKNNTQTRLVVELKPSGISKARGRIIAEKAVQLVKELNVEKMVVYISFDYDILLRIREIDDKAHTQYLNGDRTPYQLVKDGINGADYNISVFRKNIEWIDMAKKTGIVLNAWTVNSKEEMEWLLSKQFDFITTNEPELLLTLTMSK